MGDNVGRKESLGELGGRRSVIGRVRDSRWEMICVGRRVEPSWVGDVQ